MKPLGRSPFAWGACATYDMRVAVEASRIETSSAEIRFLEYP